MAVVSSCCKMLGLFQETNATLFFFTSNLCLRTKKKLVNYRLSKANRQVVMAYLVRGACNALQKKLQWETKVQAGVKP
jgi:hypothetical protein